MKRIIVHHSLTPDGPTLSWRAIYAFHTSWAYNGTIITEARARELLAAGESVKHPWLDIGYHAGCELVGTAYECLYGRPTTMAGAHTQGYNSDSLGFCFVGNYDLEEPHPEMLAVAARRVLAPWCDHFRIPVEEIHGHREYASKTCPGKLFNLDELKFHVRAALAG